MSNSGPGDEPNSPYAPATPRPMVQLVIAAEGILLGTFLDQSERAKDFARRDGAVVVELPVTHDYRDEVEL